MSHYRADCLAISSSVEAYGDTPVYGVSDRHYVIVTKCAITTEIAHALVPSSQGHRWYLIISLLGDGVIITLYAREKAEEEGEEEKSGDEILFHDSAFYGIKL